MLGADGYLGWPLTLHLSALGNEVWAVDNLSRRGWDEKCGTYSLVPIEPAEVRLTRWTELTGRVVTWRQIDLCDAEALDAVVAEFQPEAVVHLAEQRSAPFSMIDQHHAVMTQVNNVVGNLNLLFSLKRHVPDCHLVKLGTMGEYGCPNIDIEEGYITITHNGRVDRLPYPKNPHSFYHLSKVADSQNIFFACRIWDIRATDLNQGVVYGMETPETQLDPCLATRFDFDAIWGTALNRFCVQAAAGQPLTVYGKGGQTRGYLDIRDTMACIALALDNPADPGECRVFNQFTEQFTLNELAELVARCWRDSGAEVEIHHLPNPRVEAEEHYYNARHTALLELGLSPHYLGNTIIESLIHGVTRHADRIDRILLGQPSVDWRRGGNEIWHRYRHDSAISAHEVEGRARLDRAVGLSRSERSSRSAGTRFAGKSPAGNNGGGPAGEGLSPAHDAGAEVRAAGAAGDEVLGNGSSVVARRGWLPARVRFGVLEAGSLDLKAGLAPPRPDPPHRQPATAGRTIALSPGPAAPVRRPTRRAWVAGAVAVVAVVAVVLTIRALDSAASQTISAVVEPTNQVNLNFLNPGPLATIAVLPGQRVTKGQVLATQSVASGSTAVANDQATLSADQAQLSQLQQLEKVDFNAVAQVDVVETNIARDQAQLAMDRQRQSQTSLVSPVDGLVVAVSGTPGETVDNMGVRLYRPVGPSVPNSPSFALFPSQPSSSDSGTGNGTNSFAPVVTVDQWPRWGVIARVPEARISSVHPGEQTTFTLSALGGKALRCEVSQVLPNPLSVSGSTYYDVRLRLEQSAPQAILPGMTGSVALHASR